MPTRNTRTISSLTVVILLLAGCSRPQPSTASPGPAAAEHKPSYFHVDASSAAAVSGTVRFAGHRPAAQAIDMTEDPACVHAHQGKPYDQSVAIGSKNSLGNVFVYVEKGLEGKTFEAPTAPVVMDQTGCWFVPRVLGIQVGQTLKVTNSDPVTHNIHPRGTANREWNHSQGAGDPPIERHFTQPEIMVPVKCNIHSWMHAWIGVLPHPYFTVSDSLGRFEIPNLPPGTYTIAAWQEKLGTQRQTITVQPRATPDLHFVFRSE